MYRESREAARGCLSAVPLCHFGFEEAIKESQKCKNGHWFRQRPRDDLKPPTGQSALGPAFLLAADEAGEVPGEIEFGPVDERKKLSPAVIR